MFQPEADVAFLIACSAHVCPATAAAAAAKDGHENG
jgi:uncharacterized membrane protein YadS